MGGQNFSRDPAMEKIDFKKQHKDWYRPSDKKASFVKIPKLKFLMVDGQGDPNTAAEFTQAFEVLYGVSYTLKFALKVDTSLPDWTVPPPEGLWWADDMTAFAEKRKDEWLWTLMVRQPDFVTKKRIDTAAAALKKRKDPPGLSKLRFETFTEGLTAQIMHIGPYDNEGPTIEKLHAFIHGNNYELAGKHHEIYMSDPRRAKPEKLKTIIRQPITPIK